MCGIFIVVRLSYCPGVVKVSKKNSVVFMVTACTHNFSLQFSYKTVNFSPMKHFMDAVITYFITSIHAAMATFIIVELCQAGS